MTVKTLSLRIVVAGIACVLTSVQVLAQIPDWYTSHKTIRYPSEMYIIGVGSGSGSNAMEAAKKAAQMDVVSQIRVQVQAEVKNVSESFQFNKDEQIISDFRSNVRTAVSEEITGMEVIETVADKATGAAYALVVLERDKYCESLKAEMESGWKQAVELRTSSIDYAKKGKLNEAIQNLLEVRKTIAPLLPKQALYNAVAHTRYQPAVTFGPTAVTSDIRKILSTVKLEKKSGDKQKGKIGEAFAEPFVVFVTLATEGKSVPVAGSTILFESSDKTKIGDATTDDQGLASFSTTVRAMSGNGIRARLLFESLGREFDQSLNSSAVYFTWSAAPSDVSFALKVNAKSAKMNENLKGIFSSAITQIGYKVVGSSKFVIEVRVEAGPSSRVEGMAGTMLNVSADVIAVLTNKETSDELGSVKFSGKGLARSESEATEKAVGNVKIGQKDISELLEKALKK